MVERKVVVVDDEPHVLSTLAQLLESAGHTVVGKAATGEEGVCLNEALKPDVVLLDLQMPGMGGIQAANCMMSSRPVPIVICTAYYDDELVNAAAGVEVYAYVVKPCRLPDLVPAINMAVSRFEDARLLRGEVDALKNALAARKWIEQAKGILMRTRHLAEDEAHKFLQQESQRQSRPLSELAKAIVLAEEALLSGVHCNGKVAGVAA